MTGHRRSSGSTIAWRTRRSSDVRPGIVETPRDGSAGVWAVCLFFATSSKQERSMLASLFPRGGTEFFDCFDRHAAKTLEAARLLRDMLSDPKDAEQDAGRIKSIE